MSWIRAANLALRFVLELCALAAAGRPALAWTFAILVLINSSSVRARGHR